MNNFSEWKLKVFKIFLGEKSKFKFLFEFVRNSKVKIFF